jgi:hypothetical protein
MSEENYKTPLSYKPKLFDQVRAVILLKHYSIRTEDFFTNWIKKILLFHKKTSQRDEKKNKSNEVLAHLYVNK